MKYQIYAIEAWTAEDEGDWDINNWHKAGVMSIPQSFEETEILELMIDRGYLKPRAMGLVYVEDISDSIIRLYSKENFEPLYDLNLIEA